MHTEVGSQRLTESLAFVVQLSCELLPAAHRRLDFGEHDVASVDEPHVGRPMAWPGHGRLNGCGPARMTAPKQALDDPGVDRVMQEDSSIRIERQPEPTAQQNGRPRSDLEADAQVSLLERSDHRPRDPNGPRHVCLGQSLPKPHVPEAFSLICGLPAEETVGLEDDGTSEMWIATERSPGHVCLALRAGADHETTGSFTGAHPSGTVRWQNGTDGQPR